MTLPCYNRQFAIINKADLVREWVRRFFPHGLTRDQMREIIIRDVQAYIFSQCGSSYSYQGVYGTLRGIVNETNERRARAAAATRNTEPASSSGSAPGAGPAEEKPEGFLQIIGELDTLAKKCGGLDKIIMMANMLKEIKK